MNTDSRTIFPGAWPGVARRALTLVEVMVGFAVFAVALLGALTAIIFALHTIDDSRATTQATQILLNEMEAMRMREWKAREVGNPANRQWLLGYGYGTPATPVSPAVPPTPEQVRYSLAVAYPGSGFGDANLRRRLVEFGNLPARVKKEISRYREEGQTIGALGDAGVGWSNTGIVESAFTPFAVYGVLPVSPSSTHPVAQVGKEVVPTAVVQLRSTTPPTCKRYVSVFTPTGGAGLNKPAALVILYISWTTPSGVHERVLSTIISSNGINEKIIKT